MVGRKGNNQPYPLEQTHAQLAWLAQQMQKHNQAVFYLEHLQPAWLAAKQQRTYAWLAVRLPAIVIGILISILVPLFFAAPPTLSSLLQHGALGGLFGGLWPNPMKDLESQRAPRHLWSKRLITSVCIGLIYGLSFLFYSPNPYYTLNIQILDGLSYGVSITLSSLLLQYLLIPPENSTTRRGQRLLLFRSATLVPYALVIAVVSGLIFGPIIGLICGLGYILISLTVSTGTEDIDLLERTRSIWQRLLLFRSATLVPYALVVAVVCGLIFGPIIGLICGLGYILISLTVSTGTENIDGIERTRSIWRRTVWIRYIRRTAWRRWQRVSRFFLDVQGPRVLLVAIIIALSYGLDTGFSAVLNWSGILNASPRLPNVTTGFPNGSTNLMGELANALNVALSATLGLGLHAALLYGLSFALISLTLSIQMTDIHLTERIRWTWNSLLQGLFNAGHLRISALLTSISIVIIGLSYALSGSIPWLTNTLTFGLINSLSFGVSYWLLFGLFQGITLERIEDQDRRKANEGIHHSLRNSVIIGIIAGAIIGSFGALIFPLNIGLSNGLSFQLSGLPSLGVSYWLNFGLGYSLSVGLAAGISGALLTYMLTGGLAVWRHYVIRLLLWRSHTFPWQAPQFLNGATDRSLLQRVGGGYSFPDRLSLDQSELAF